jgi:adenylate cyclase
MTEATPPPGSTDPVAKASAATRMRRFRVDVGTIVCAVALVQSLLLVALGYWGAQRLVSRVGESAHKVSHDRVEDNVLAFLAKTQAVVHAVGDSPSLHPLGEDGERSAESCGPCSRKRPSSTASAWPATTAIC